MAADQWLKKFFAKPSGVRHILVAGVFKRILIIEMILLVWSLGYRALTEPADMAGLFWYALRILVLVAIIILFVTISLSRFLNRKIIKPLEAITEANLSLNTEAPVVNPVILEADPPDEIKEIVDTRQRMLSAILDVSTERLRLVNFIKDTFGRYLSQKVVDRILESPEARALGGRRTTVTILMADLRGFTSLTDAYDPEEIVSLLNRYFGAMAKIIYAYDGMIDEFLGDGILVIFGVPERHEDDPARAVACALEMQNAMTKLNRDIAGSGFAPLQMGIGINTGNVVVGNIGSEIRAKYGIVGMPVNTASRIESITTGGQVLIGEETYNLLQHIVTVDKPQSIMTKGLRRPLVCYPVTRIEKPVPVVLEAESQTSREVAIQLPFSCWVVDGKKIRNQVLQGHTTSMIGDDLHVVVQTRLERHTQLKLQLKFCTEIHCFGDIYANVLSAETREKDCPHHLRITAIAPEDRKLLEEWLQAAA